MKNITFTDDDKIRFFDKIADNFYNANFGQLSKSDMELLMFHFYIEKMIETCKSDDGTVDYNKCSDYKISQDLGITQQRVRSLKVKNQLKNPIEFDWKKAFAKLTENARYDRDTRKITINIPNPNLYIEIQNFIEENGAHIEKQLNSKILQLRVEYYIDLILSLESDDSRNKIIKELKKQFKEADRYEKKFDEKNVGKSLIELSANITSTIANLQSFMSPQNCLGLALISLIKRTESAVYSN